MVIMKTKYTALLSSAHQFHHLLYYPLYLLDLSSSLVYLLSLTILPPSIIFGFLLTSTVLGLIWNNQQAN